MQEKATNWKTEVLQPVSRIVVESLVNKAWDKLTEPKADKLITYARIGVRIGKLIRYLK